MLIRTGGCVNLCMLFGGILEEFVVLNGVGRCAYSGMVVFSSVDVMGRFGCSVWCSVGVVAVHIFVDFCVLL